MFIRDISIYESISLPEWEEWKWKSLSCVWLFATQWTNLQDRILERVAIPFSRRSSQPRDPIQVSCNAGGFVGGGGGGGGF